MATYNQLQSFLENLENPKTDTLGKKVYEYIKLRQTVNYNEVIEYFFNTHNVKTSSSGAVFSRLLDGGIIKETTVGVFEFVEDEKERKILRHKRDDEKFEKWEKKGYEEGWIAKIQAELINRLDKNII